MSRTGPGPPRPIESANALSNCRGSTAYKPPSSLYKLFVAAAFLTADATPAMSLFCDISKPKDVTSSAKPIPNGVSPMPIPASFRACAASSKDCVTDVTCIALLASSPPRRSG